MIKKLSLLFFVLLNYIVYSQETNIPDTVFENYLETHDATGAIVPLNDPTSMGNGVIDDNKVTTANIINVTVLNIASLGISNLTGIEDFTALEELNCSSNLLTQINITKNTALKNLYLTSNKLTALDLKFNPNLFQVAIADNDLTLLDVRNGQNGLIGTFDARANYDLKCILVDNPSLSSLVLWQVDTATFGEHCSETNIPDTAFENYLETHDATGAIVPLNDPTSMGNGVANDTKVTTANIINVVVLNIANLGISNLTGIEDFTALEELNCSSNLLTQINITKNTALKNLYLTSNKLTALDLKFNPNLFQVAIADNDLTLLDVRNGQNGLIGTFDARANYDLECILVDNPSLSSLVLWQVDTATFGEHCNETNIPDTAFETYLETHDANGISDDDYVYTSAIKNVTTLSINGSFVPPGQVADPATIISDATGVHDFIALEELSFNKNELVSIDLSKNTALVILSLIENKLKNINLSQNTLLEKLNISKNELTELDVTLHTALTYLSCVNNDLTAIDVSKNTILTSLFCRRNALTNLNVTQNTVLTKLSCYSNPIGNLDVSKNLLLEDLDCVATQLTSLDVTLNTKLTVLQCYENTLTSLDVTKNTALLELYCSSNQIESLDLTQNPLLGEIELQENALISLNLKNGNNVNLDVEVQDNPNLYCILVDDATATYLNSKTWDKDAQAYYSTDCRLTSIPDIVFEDYLETHDANGTIVPTGDPTSMGNGVANDGFVTTEKIENVTNLNVSNQSIASLTGIENFLALEELRCFKNNLKALDISNNTALTYLNCSRNEIESLDVSNNIALLKLSCYTNPIGSLDVTLNTLLESLDCVENELTSLNVTQNINLETLYTYVTRPEIRLHNFKHYVQK